MTTTVQSAAAAASKAAPASTEVKSSTNQREQRWQTVQNLMFAVGAVLMPAGLVAVGFGWYGAAHAHYAYDQFPYLLSGGLLGVCLTTLGGFLYFGAWQAKTSHDQKNASKHLTEAVLALTEVSKQIQVALAGGAAAADLGSESVVAGANGATIHRRDCALIAKRDDLRAVTAQDAALSRCRVCEPAAL